MFHPSSWVCNSLHSLDDCLWCTTSLYGAARFFSTTPPIVMTSPWGREAVKGCSLSASFSFRIGTMTSSLPWKFHLPSCASSSVRGLRVPIKRGSQISFSTEHIRVLKLLDSRVSAPGKPLLSQDHEALRDCPFSPRARGCLLHPGSLSTK